MTLPKADLRKEVFDMFHSRKPTRLPNFDYSSDNYYFVTMCTHEKACIFGTTEKLIAFGKIAKNDMMQLACHYPEIRIDNFIIMPNHVHAIVVIQSHEEAEKKTTLDEIVGQYKSGVSRKIRQIEPNIRVWQRSFHDHIIRSQASYEKIWNYVEYNALKWEADCFFPDSVKT